MKVLLTAFTLILSVILCIGCGGGTRGSGGQYYEGFVGDSSGRALSDVSVTILSTGDSAVTDTSGNFTIETEDQAGTVAFLLESPSFSGQVSREIPPDSARVFIRFAVSGGSKPDIEATVEVKESRPRPTRIPTPKAPTPTSQSPVSPAPSPSRTPDDDDSGDDNSDDDDSDDNDSDDDTDDDRTPRPSPSSSPSPSPTAGPREGESTKAEGRITSLSASSVVVEGVTFVPSSSTEYRREDGERISLSDFKVGDSVEARGRITAGTNMLQRLEKD